MARLDSWLSPGVLHALGWALIHALWQDLALAALAAVAMAVSRRPSVRYGIAVGALVLMLAAPMATFFVFMKSASVADAGISMPAVPPMAISASPAMPGKGVAMAVEKPANLPSRLLAPDVLSPNILPWLVGAWLLGVTLFSLRLAGGFLLLEHRRRKQSAALNPRIHAMCQQLQRQLGLDRAIRYLECGWLQAPAVIGWIRPIVFLPVSALTGLNEEQLRAVIAHELAHIRRLDAFVNLFQMLVETGLFYHPAVWWLNRRIRAERELCCDEIAVSLTGNRLEYARALTRMAEWEKAPALAMAANRGSLSERVFHVMEPEPFGAGQRMLGLTGSVLFLAAALISANILFRNAYPIPVARAQASIKAALASSRVVINHAMQQVLQASEPAATNATAKQVNHNEVASRQTNTSDQAPSTNDSYAEKLVVPSPDLSGVVPIQIIPTPTLMASNAPPTVPEQQSPARGLLADELLPFARTVVDSRPGPLAPAKASELTTEYVCHNTSAVGRVISPRLIQMGGFNCDTFAEYVSFRAYGGNIIMNVELRLPAGPEKMVAGKTVTIAGDFKVLVKHHVEYLVAEDARVLYVSPFGQSALPAPDGRLGLVQTNGFHVNNDPVIPEPPVGPVQGAAGDSANTASQ